MHEKRTFQQIARDIKVSWLNVYFGAVPYLEILLKLDTTNKDFVYKHYTAGQIAEFFLTNANTYRGNIADALKNELKSLICM